MSCKKTSLQEGNRPQNFDQIFDNFFKGVKVNYAFWDIDKTNWDSVQTIYKPLFHALNLNNPNDVRRSVGYFNNMTKSLIDSHFNIIFKKGEIKDSLVFPARYRKLIAGKLGQELDYSNLDTNYLDNSFRRAAFIYTQSGNQSLLFTQVGTIKNQIIYFKATQFAIVNAINANDSATQNVISYLDLKLQNSKGDLNGIIFDLRGNNGGNVADLSFLLQRILNANLDYGFLRYKDGSSSLDFTSWVPTTITASAAKLPKLRIVVLVDAYSASLSEIFTIAIRSLPNSAIVGEQTWGATSPLAENSVFNYGSFEIPGFLKVTMAAGEFRDKQMKNFEGVGITPDYLIPSDLKSFQNGKDVQLEKAINIIYH